MAETSGFFDAEELIDGGYDREYLAEQWANYFKLFIGNGVFSSPTNQLKVVANSGMIVTLRPGWAWINGYWYHNDSNMELEIPSNTTASILRVGIFIQFNSANREIKVVAASGRTSPNRTAPYYELKIAEIAIDVGVSEITDAMITDTRPDSSYCGFVTGIVNVIDSTDLFAQYQAIFDDFYEHMKDQLDEDAAGHLQLEIDELRSGSYIEVTTTNSSLRNQEATITDSQGNSVTSRFDTNLKAVFTRVPLTGDLTISATDGEQTATLQTNIAYFSKYAYTIAFWAATVNITTTSQELYDAPISVYKDNVLIGSTAFDSSGHCEYTASSPGTYRFATTYSGETYDATVVVTSETTYSTIINVWTATLEISTQSTELHGAEITVKDSSNNIVGTTTFNNSGQATFSVHVADTYTLSCTYGGRAYSSTVTVTSQTTYQVSINTFLTKAVTMYGAANAIITWTNADGSSGSVTMNSSGSKSTTVIIDSSGSNITFTDTTVAKNPNNLSQNYTKTVTVTNATTEIKVMPDGAIYWYGYNPYGLNNSITPIGAEGYGAGALSIIFNTNDITHTYYGSQNYYIECMSNTKINCAGYTTGYLLADSATGLYSQQLVVGFNNSIPTQWNNPNYGLASIDNSNASSSPKKYEHQAAQGNLPTGEAYLVFGGSTAQSNAGVIKLKAIVLE